MSETLSNLVASDPLSEVGRLGFIIRAALSGVRTSVPVRVVSVTNSGGVSPIGQVSVEPLVGALDGNGNVIPHGIIENVPYLRYQGGSNAVILDPEPGDIGLASAADRDISSVKGTGQPGSPGSLRRFSLSDIVYLMTIIGAAPTQYIQFESGGINIVSPTAVSVTAPDVSVSASNSASVTTGTASVTATTSATVKSPSIILQNAGAALQKLLNATLLSWLSGHQHSNGNGGSNTGTPTTSIPAGVQTSVVSAE